jgi:transposase
LLGQAEPSLMHGGRIRGEYSEAFVAFDVSKTRHAVAIAEGGRGGEVRFLGEVSRSPAAVEPLIRKLAGRYAKLHLCYEVPA